MNSDAQDAEIMRLRLQSGLSSVANVVEWADEVIATRDNPQEWLINLSLSRTANPHDVVSILYSIAKGADRYAAIRTLLGEMFDVIIVDRGRARTFANALYQLAIENAYEFPPDLRFINGIDDEFCLATEGIYKTLDQEIDDFTEILRKFGEQGGGGYGSPAACSPSPHR